MFFIHLPADQAAQIDTKRVQRWVIRMMILLMMMTFRIAAKEAPESWSWVEQVSDDDNDTDDDDEYDDL